jgi:hypothetical protein
MQINVYEKLKKAVSTRYKVYSKEEVETIGASRKADIIVGDSLVASTMVNPDIVLPVNTQFISPTLAGMFGANVVSFDYLLSILEIDLDKLKSDLEELKAARVNLILVGYGGYSINTIEFLYQFCTRFGITDLFKYVAIFEDDNLTYTNCLRIYPSIHTPAEKSNKIHKFDVFSEKYDGVISDNINLVMHRLDAETYNEYYKGQNVTLLGAPDFETRQLLEDARFIFGGHAGDEISIINNPVVNAQITTESYGTINPTTLFLNLIKGAAELPKALLNKEAPNTVLFDYNCKRHINTDALGIDLLFDAKNKRDLEIEESNLQEPQGEN